MSNNNLNDKEDKQLDNKQEKLLKKMDDEAKGIQIFNLDNPEHVKKFLETYKNLDK